MSKREMGRASIVISFGKQMPARLAHVIFSKTFSRSAPPAVVARWVGRLAGWLAAGLHWRSIWAELLIFIHSFASSSSSWARRLLR